MSQHTKRKAHILLVSIRDSIIVANNAKLIYFCTMCVYVYSYLK